MQNTRYILTVMAKDKPGIVQAISEIILANQGSWLESSLSRLGGQFAGIIAVIIPDESLDDFKRGLADIVADGITVKIQSFNEGGNVSGKPATILVEANDRFGIIDEISSALAQKSVNVEKLVSECESASMAGYDLFKAKVHVILPEGFTVNQLQTLMENVSDDLMVVIKSPDTDN